MGQLRNKCVVEMGPESETATGNWTEWILDEQHWFINPDRGQPELCGNASGARCELRQVTKIHRPSCVIRVP